MSLGEIEGGDGDERKRRRNTHSRGLRRSDGLTRLSNSCRRNSERGEGNLERSLYIKRKKGERSELAREKRGSSRLPLLPFLTRRELRRLTLLSSPMGPSTTPPEVVVLRSPSSSMEQWTWEMRRKKEKGDGELDRFSLSPSSRASVCFSGTKTTRWKLTLPCTLFFPSQYPETQNSSARITD